MSDWVGFTDADLQRMKSKTAGQSGGARVIKPVSGGRPKSGSGVGQKPQRKQNSKTVTKSTKSQGGVPAAAMLSKPTNVTKKEEKVTSPPGTPNDQIPLHGKTFPPVSDADDAPSNEKEILSKELVFVEDENIIKGKEKIKLEDVQRRQKEMEEKNKRKKTMLTKAIAERKKRAFAESTKLVQIQAELAKLDTMLNYDVSILRDRIDEACAEYNSSQKRFEKAEAEYISAKICLHKATEMKEDLTEHLYRLIQLNEERKANKLEELMQKLELEEIESKESTPPNPESLKPNSNAETDKVSHADQEALSHSPEVKSDVNKTDKGDEQEVES